MTSEQDICHLVDVLALLAYQVVKVFNLRQTVVVQLQLLEVDQSIKVINLDNVLEAKSQVLNVFVTHGVLLLLYVCSSSTGSFQVM